MKMNLIDHFSLQKDKFKKNTTNTFGPWIDDNEKPFSKTIHKDFNISQSQTHTFLDSIKKSNRTKRISGSERKVQKIQLTEPSIQKQPFPHQSQHEEMFNRDDWFSKPKNSILATTAYLSYNRPNLDVSEQKRMPTGERQNLSKMKPRAGSQNLQKILKLKEKLRHRNQAIMKKVKEKCSLQLTQPSHEMEQMKKYISISTPRKQAKSNRQAKAIFYQTLDALPKTNNPSYL